MDNLLAVDLSDFWQNTPAQSSGIIESPQSLISSILPNIYILAGVMLLVYLVFGGFLVITAAGSTDQADRGKSAITNALIGLGIVFCSYWIIQAIQVLTGIDIL